MAWAWFEGWASCAELGWTGLEFWSTMMAARSGAARSRRRAHYKTTLDIREAGDDDAAMAVERRTAGWEGERSGMRPRVASLASPWSSRWCDRFTRGRRAATAGAQIRQHSKADSAQGYELSSQALGRDRQSAGPAAGAPSRRGGRDRGGGAGEPMGARNGGSGRSSRLGRWPGPVPVGGRVGITILWDSRCGARRWTWTAVLREGPARTPGDSSGIGRLV